MSWIMKGTAAGLIVLAVAGIIGAEPTAARAQASLTPDALQTQIEGLKAAKPAWREIRWKTCLIEGLKESREQKKPVLLWIFIDRPIDDARC